MILGIFSSTIDAANWLRRNPVGDLERVWVGALGHFVKGYVPPGSRRARFKSNIHLTPVLESL